MSDLQRDAEIVSGVMSAMPGWRFASPPEGFGWAPMRHLRATLTHVGKQQRIIIRQSWSSEGFVTESFLYNAILPHLNTKTPKLLAVFELASDGSKWMVLDDLGGRHPDGSSTDDQRAVFTALGSLHGECLALAAMLSSTPLPVFAAGSLAEDWMPLVTWAATQPHFDLPKNISITVDSMCRKLAQQPLTLVHGDTDASNMIISDNEAALIDWERAKLGPPSLDLGKALEAVGSQDALTAYRTAFTATSGYEVVDRQIEEWADLAMVHNCLHWICYFIRRTQQESNPDLEWRRNHYEPSVCHLRELTADWS